MIRKILLAVVFTSLGLSLRAQQFVTPGTGVKWTPDSLAVHAPAFVSGAVGSYTFNDSLFVSASDTLWFDQTLTFLMGQDALIEVRGAFISDGPDALVTAADSTQPYAGFRFEDSSSVYIKNTTFSHGGGLRVLTGDFAMDSSAMIRNVSGISTGGAISFSRGNPRVTYSLFRDNELPAFSSGANQEVAAFLAYNYLENNNTSNSNRPQINMGPSGSDTTYVVGNTIIGTDSLTNVGGVSVSSLLGITSRAVIDENIIRNNRYGITMAGGNSFGYMRRNVLEDNDTQGDPNLGGSGISINSNTNTLLVVASENQIRRNLWGITVIGQASINLGDTAAATFNIGENVFSENGNGGLTYALYNNTDLPISAMNNCWIEDSLTVTADVESVISHVNDDPSLGEVFFSPFLCALDTTDYTSLDNAGPFTFAMYPNPSNGSFNLEYQGYAMMEMLDMSGKKVYARQVQPGNNMIEAVQPSGVYIIRIVANNSNHISTAKMIIDDRQ